MISGYAGTQGNLCSCIHLKVLIQDLWLVRTCCNYNSCNWNRTHVAPDIMWWMINVGDSYQSNIKWLYGKSKTFEEAQQCRKLLSSILTPSKIKKVEDVGQPVNTIERMSWINIILKYQYRKYILSLKIASMCSGQDLLNRIHYLVVCDTNSFIKIKKRNLNVEKIYFHTKF